jgi:hypothetical protein
LNRYCALGAALNQYCSAKSGRLLFDSIAHGRRVLIAAKLAAQAQSVCWRTTLSRSSQPILIEEAHWRNLRAQTIGDNTIGLRQDRRSA